MSVRLTLKLPATKAADMESNLQSSGRRKATKRRVVSDDEEDDHDQTISTAAPSSPQGTASLRELSHTVEGDSDFEPDHATPALASEDLVAEPSPPTRPKKRKARDGPPPTKRKRTHAAAHPDDDFHMAAASGDDNDDLPVQGKRQSKPTAKAKARGVKAKAPVDGNTQERKARHGKSEASRSAGTKRQRASSKVDDATVDVVGDLDVGPETRSPSQPKEPTSPLPKKRKLPKIHKNKPAGTASGSTSAKPPLPASDPTKPAVPVIPESKTARKTPGMLGNADFDLRDSSVYKELFKAPTGSNPRGLSRQDRDKERRKELDKLRDEARAKRLAEMTVSFNLQAQSEKIERFEERLRNEKSSAIFPNFLAAKWRELWERDRRKSKEQGRWAQGTSWGQSGEREEGEMNDQAS